MNQGVNSRKIAWKQIQSCILIIGEVKPDAASCFFMLVCPILHTWLRYDIMITHLIMSKSSMRSHKSPDQSGSGQRTSEVVVCLVLG